MYSSIIIWPSISNPWITVSLAFLTTSVHPLSLWEGLVCPVGGGTAELDWNICTTLLRLMIILQIAFGSQSCIYWKHLCASNPIRVELQKLQSAWSITMVRAVRLSRTKDKKALTLSAWHSLNGFYFSDMWSVLRGENQTEFCSLCHFFKHLTR